MQIPKRVVVIGGSCAGKTTFSSRLAFALSAKHIELDALHWEANWREADINVFKSRVAEALKADSWVADGNYTNKVKDLVWPMADTLIWLDPPLHIILRRFFYRSLSRSLKGELLWGHSKETFRSNIFSRNSLLIWILTTHKRRNEAYKKLVDHPPKDTVVHRFGNEKQIAEYFQMLLKRD